MSEIRSDGSAIALINTFFVDPANADRLVAMLDQATDKVMRGIPGFISANIHKSLDGTRVVNYAQWRSKEDFDAMRSNPAAIPHMKEIAAIAERFEPILYDVVSVHDG